MTVQEKKNLLDQIWKRHDEAINELHVRLKSAGTFEKIESISKEFNCAMRSLELQLNLCNSFIVAEPAPTQEDLDRAYSRGYNVAFASHKTDKKDWVEENNKFRQALRDIQQLALQNVFTVPQLEVQSKILEILSKLPCYA